MTECATENSWKENATFTRNQKQESITVQHMQDGTTCASY